MSSASEELVQRLRARRAAFDAALGAHGLTTPVTCPCCGFPGQRERSSYVDCSFCGWTDDGTDDRDADEHNLTNGTTLSDARLAMARDLRDPSTSTRTNMSGSEMRVLPCSADRCAARIEAMIATLPASIAPAFRAAAALV